MRGIRAVAFWAFVAGFLNGLLLAIGDHVAEWKNKKEKDAAQPKPP